MLSLYNTLNRRVEPFEPLDKTKVGLYTCGPTVYNYAHIGNFRAYVFEDLLRRALRYWGYDVCQVMNLTDVDDKTIRDSQRVAMSLEAFTGKYKDAFFQDVATLRIEPAEHYPAATEHIPEMIELVRTLVDKGYGYQADDGSVYFSLAKFPDYGKLARVSVDPAASVSRVKHDDYAKESAADFALWKAWSEEDGDVYWDSPWGRGRPGWHIECSAMSMKYLGKTFDIHTGGIDNMFPHHEDEIAQSEAANGCTFVRYWLHCAHLMVDGGKMSKSLGNFYTLRDVVQKGFTGREVRWILLGAHYRQPLNFTFQACHDARAALQRLDDSIVRIKEAEQRPDAGVEEARARAQRAEAEFREGLGDDLNISAAQAALFDLVRDANRRLDAGELGGKAASGMLDQLRQFDRVFATLDVDVDEDVPPGVMARARERQEARQAKDYGRADAIRDALAAEGWVIEDTASGPRIKRS